MKNIYCIVVPVYKDKLDITEELSFKRLKELIGKTVDVYLICPEGINTKQYKKIYSQIKIKEFDKKWFENTKSYSHLLINYDFYKAFDEYEYMYIYQLDCYLFKNELQEWVNKGYDYIGGPILSPLSGWAEPNKQWKPIVGNGGFSLRKIEKFKEITDPNGEYRTYYNITDETLKDLEFEDKYFCKFVYNRYEFNTPDWREAMYFAFDMNVNIYYDNMNFKGFPMACHAWPKNIRYWVSHCDEMNNKEIIDFCEEKHKEYFELYYKDFEERQKILVEREQKAIEESKKAKS